MPGQPSGKCSISQRIGGAGRKGEYRPAGRACIQANQGLSKAQVVELRRIEHFFGQRGHRGRRVDDGERKQHAEIDLDQVNHADRHQTVATEVEEVVGRPDVRASHDIAPNAAQRGFGGVERPPVRCEQAPWCSHPGSATRRDRPCRCG